jgi:hypothetical protein
MELKRKSLGEEAKAKAKGKSESPSGAKEEAAALGAGKEPDESLPEGNETISGNEASEAEADTTHPDEGAVSGRVRPRFAKALRFGVPALGLLLVVAGLFLIMKFKPHTTCFSNALPRLEPVTSIMRPIPAPDYREMLDFLLVYEIDTQNMITAVRMEVGFQNPTRYQNFKDQNVAFRDTVYSFLLQQNLSGSTLKSWHSIVEKDLLDYLRVKLPQSYADTLGLAQVENL